MQFDVTLEVKMRVEADEPEKARQEAMMVLMTGQDTENCTWRGAGIVSILEAKP